MSKTATLPSNSPRTVESHVISHAPVCCAANDCQAAGFHPSREQRNAVSPVKRGERHAGVDQHNCVGLKMRPTEELNSGDLLARLYRGRRGKCSGRDGRHPGVRPWYDFDAGQSPIIPTAWTELARSAEFRYRAEI